MSAVPLSAVGSTDSSQQHECGQSPAGYNTTRCVCVNVCVYVCGVGVYVCVHLQPLGAARDLLTALHSGIRYQVYDARLP